MSQTVYVLGEGDIVHWVTGDAVIGDAWEAQGGAFWQEARFVEDPEYSGPTGEDDETPGVVTAVFDMVDGCQFSNGWLAPKFITDTERMEAVLINPYIWNWELGIL